MANTNDHLRRHDLLLTPAGWRLAPAYALNPIPPGYGLKLNSSKTDHALDPDLVREVAPFFGPPAARVEAMR